MCDPNVVLLWPQKNVLYVAQMWPVFNQSQIVFVSLLWPVGALLRPVVALLCPSVALLWPSCSPLVVGYYYPTITGL